MGEKVLSAQPKVLFISASDSSSLAGHEQDLRAAFMSGCTGMVALTGSTVQTYRKVLSLYPSDARYFCEAIAAAKEGGCGAVKVGAILSRRILEIAAAGVGTLPNVVWDPVFSATGGSFFYSNDMINFFTENILRRVLLCTPNRGEIEIIARQSFSSQSEAVDWASQFEGRPAFLVKGGHFDEESSTVCDYLVSDRVSAFRRERKDFSFFRGSGCLLSSLIACALAKGASLHDAVASAIPPLEEFYAGRNR